jgi:predicted AlkP superfamily pyrophosphatase or phosphodiesterase
LLGQFPLFNFWGPAADIRSSRWIMRCAEHVFDTRRPRLTLVYVPHLDYPLQKLGPEHPHIPKYLREVDDLCGELIEHVRQDGAEVIVLSEYGITPVSDAVLINRALRRAGLLRVREEMGREQLDAGISDAFAVCDHQVAHVYVQRPALIPEVKALLEGLSGIERVLDEAGKRELGLDHPRSGELVAISNPDRWFAYYHWLDDTRAPDYARTVDIHRKPGYDPVELFLDPALPIPQLSIARRLLQKKAGFRTLMDVIPLDPSLVRGSHGRLTEDPSNGPLLISSRPDLLPEKSVRGVEIKGLILDHLFGADGPHRRS